MNTLPLVKRCATPCLNILKLIITAFAAIVRMAVSVPWRLKLSRQLNWMSTQYGQDHFRDLWSYKTKPWARKHLKQWFWWATHSLLEPLREFAWMIRRHEENILTWFRMPINNGSVEGLNNKAKVVSHKAYRFRTADHFICILCHCMGNLPAPPLMHRFV